MNPCKSHKFVKFDEDRIFCEKCGLFMLAARQAPVYIPDWTYRPYVPPPVITWPLRPLPYWTITSGDTTTVTADTGIGNVTYTVGSGSD